jgi:hypothetical protein
MHLLHRRGGSVRGEGLGEHPRGVSGASSSVDTADVMPGRHRMAGARDRVDRIEQMF